MTTKHVGWFDLPRDRILATALDVQCDYALAKIVIKLGLDTQVPDPDLLDTAICEAESVGFRDANWLDVPASGPTMPAYFADEHELASAWNRGVERARRLEIMQHS